MLPEEFRACAMSLLDKWGKRGVNSEGKPTGVIFFDRDPLSFMNDNGHLVVQDYVEGYTVWDDRISKNPEFQPYKYYLPYVELVERWAVLERLADL